MINTYNINDIHEHQDLLQLVVDSSQIEENGEFNAYELGSVDSPFKLQGFTFIIDKNTAEQLDKIAIKMEGFKPILVVKDGETFDDNGYLSSVKQRIALLEEELEKERAKLNG